MSLKIKKISPESAEFNRFYNFPKGIYPEDSPKWKVPEDFDFKNLIAIYGVEDENNLLARAALYQNPNLNFQNQPTCSIGNYEAENHPKAAQILIDQVSEDAKKLGAKFLLGPMNGSTWSTYRFAESTNSPFFLEPHYLNYYQKHFLNAGFKSVRNYNSKLVEEIPTDSLEPENELIELQKSLKVNVRPINMTDFAGDLKKLHELVHQAFAHNFLFTPLGKEEFVQKYMSTEKILNQEYTRIAEDEDGNFLAFFFCLDDHLNPAEKRLIIKTIARHPDPKWKGLGQLMGSLLYRKAKKDGYQSIIHALMDEDANSSSISTKFAGKPINRYFLYAKEL
ncbi:hypothetical protein MATR_07490 [Marivirga tractuosa]|uniref:N-acetyltransferase domain-containing protein n=1 Tax=Marivirga tractuosa (strain ATCC 23168 / DSM 4126 / NBRC 15989 / NCIMB 1408 / VKM B-1430 / H-43) TaxID=643867 RepID=E4TQ74_MARTH|nr:hypothetical protein [Marivirga tractuosa]ADR21620.1 hypothetical protein Ftrac_1631 [Marivirga tractuosa DSM 4126]BDD13924.1 hypothetical protein MATR_07490 [Marivirga tractuosa]